MTRGTAVLMGVGVFVFAIIVLLGRTAQSPANDPRSDCIAYANEIVAKNSQAVWISVYNSCAANSPAANGDRLELGPKAVRTQAIAAPIGTRSVPSPADPR